MARGAPQGAPCTGFVLTAFDLSFLAWRRRLGGRQVRETPARLLVFPPVSSAAAEL